MSEQKIYVAWFDWGEYETQEFLGVFTTHAKAVEGWARYASSVHGRTIEPAQAAFDDDLRVQEVPLDALATELYKWGPKPAVDGTISSARGEGG